MQGAVLGSGRWLKECHSLEQPGRVPTAALRGHVPDGMLLQLNYALILTVGDLTALK